MPTKVFQLPDVGKVTLSQNFRSKRIKLTVKPNQKILVSFPYIVSFNDALKFVAKNSDWILQQQQKLNLVAAKTDYSKPLQTRFHTVKIQPGGETFTVKHKKFDIEIFYPEKLTVEDSKVKAHIQNIMTHIYRWEAKRFLPVRIVELGAKHNLQFNQVNIRNNKTNWGSCSGHNNISLNLQLMKLPDHLIDFILLHELAHTRVKNHGPEFWKLLDTLTNKQAQQLTAEVKKYSTYSI